MSEEPKMPVRVRMSDCWRHVCQAYVVETEPPMDPPLILCANPDCERAVRMLAPTP